MYLILHLKSEFFEINGDKQKEHSTFQVIMQNMDEGKVQRIKSKRNAEE